jgi:voltage-gated potassium channel
LTSPTSRYESIKVKVHQLLDPEVRATTRDRLTNLLLTTLIVVNVLAVVLETMPALRTAFASWFDRIEQVSVAIFTIEYAARIWTATADPRFAGPVRGRLRFAMTPMALVDLVAILPSYLAGMGLLDLRYMRGLRLVRMLRVFKIARYSDALATFGKVFASRRPELGLIALFLGLLMILASTSMYQAEHAAQPELFSSVPAVMWWTITTLTTVGYGDMYPVTPWGRTLGGVISLLGIGFFALPAGLLAAAFAEEISSKKKARGTCPQCGQAMPERATTGRAAG